MTDYTNGYLIRSNMSTNYNENNYEQKNSLQKITWVCDRRTQITKAADICVYTNHNVVIEKIEGQYVF